MLSRPQPIGVLPLPAGWVVLPSPELVPEAGEIVRRLLSGHLPEAWPDALEAFARAAEGEVEAAAALIDPTGGGIAAYNHFVLTGEWTRHAQHGAHCGWCNDIATCRVTPPPSRKHIA